MRVAIFDRVEPPVPTELPLRLIADLLPPRRHGCSWCSSSRPCSRSPSPSLAAHPGRRLVAPGAARRRRAASGARARDPGRDRVLDLSAVACRLKRLVDSPGDDAHRRDRRDGVVDRHRRRPFPQLDVVGAARLVHRRRTPRARLAVGHAPRVDPRAPRARKIGAPEPCRRDMRKARSTAWRRCLATRKFRPASSIASRPYG